MARSFPTLKEFYYLDHFEEMISFLRRHIPNALGEEGMRFLADFETMPKPAKALLIRLANRRGLVFARKSLTYREIGNLDLAINELSQRSFVSRPTEEHFGELLLALTKANLLEVLDHAKINLRGMRGLPKASLVDFARQRCPFEVLEEQGYTGQFVIQNRAEEIEYLHFLFFGRDSDGLQAFTLRDLGILKTQREGEFKPRFRDEAEARTAYFYSRLRPKIRTANPAELIALSQEASAWPASGKEKAIARLGKALERAKETETAIAIYRQSKIHPSRERLVRLLFAKGERYESRALLQTMIADPSTDDELLFAEDFFARKFSRKALGKLTQVLRDASVIQLDEAHRGRAEEAARQHFCQNGHPTHHAENHFWATLFGVYFWDELNTSRPNEFDFRPTEILDSSFYQNNASTIETKLKSLDPEIIDHVFDHHFKTPNGIFQWKENDRALLKTFIKTAPQNAVSEALRKIAQAPQNHRAGYPDLLQFKNGGCRFIEVKAEGDQIQRHQLARISSLQKMGFAVEVVRVAWGVDPDQEYVVVDVETTGTRPGSDRITEIGAVKVKGGKIVEKFQTLVNPGRPIPWRIVELTGITDAMVADAPRFEEIAEKFLTFFGNAIFVAHNARFDYGFMKHELARSGHQFSSPTLCTVVEMRRAFPKLKSYKLARLCQHFEINLSQHHRALCDALATAKLLHVINQKRKKKKTSSSNP